MEEKIEHPWEYTQIVQVATPNIEIDHKTKEGKQSLINASGQVFRKLPQIIDKLPSGGWQVNSHSIFLVEDSVMVSLLLQRPKRV